MSTIALIILIVYAVLNVISFTLYGLDKYKAVREKWRIPEASLLIAAVFGVIGAILGMIVFRHKIRKPKFKIGVPVIFVVEAAVVIAFAVYANTYSRAVGVEEYLVSGDTVKVSEINSGWYFDGPGTDVALIFYPGGKVDTMAYAPLMYALAEDGIDCFLPDMPLHFAIFAVNKADSIITDDAYSGYTNWYVGGHSLGGASAALYAANSKSTLSDKGIRGLVMLAAFETKDMTDTDIRALVIYGSNDGVLDMTKLEAGRSCFKEANYTEICIDGGNHAQFGLYGKQDGDGEATISTDEQLRQTVEYIEEFVEAD